MVIIASMPKLLILSYNTDEYAKLIQQADLPNLKIVTDPAECDIVLGEPKKIRDALPLLSHLKWAQSIYAGVEPLVQPGQRRDYVLTNARGVFGELMSEYVFGYLLLHEKKMLERIRTQQAKQWDRAETGWLRGKTIGLLGVGSIGAHLAGTAKHFSMNVWGYTKESETSTQVDRYFHPDGLESDSLLSFAKGLDYLIVVLPRTKGTNQIVDANVLNALPSHALIINVGRGNAIDEPALVEALIQKKIAGAILDVTEKEPLPVEHPFWTAPNLLLTFHTSAISYPEDITKLFIENYKLYMEGKSLKAQVDFEKGY
jgi:phosphoglycerate dehydrogenase-like enzyme